MTRRLRCRPQAFGAMLCTLLALLVTALGGADGQSGLLPAYTVMHAFASYDVPRAPLRLRASVRNLFDRVYITQRNEGIYTGMRRLLRTEVQWTLG